MEGTFIHRPNCSGRSALERRREFTLNVAPYTLTHLDFPNYSAAMESQMSGLESKIRQTVDLCQRLREENRQLRQQLADAEIARRILSEKINGASERLEQLLQRVPD